MIEGFWSRPPEYGRSREVDPLALSTIHEAAADILLPFLSGRTRSAADYLWVLVGLRWAGARSASDIDIWDAFETFEKALKLTWYHRGKRQGFTGVDAVRDHYDGGRAGLDFKLLANQRSQGLLGAYLRSLRDCQLVERRSLRLAESGRALIDTIQFRWHGELSGYGWLDRVFQRAEAGFSSRVLRDLGAALFDPEPMRDVAIAIRARGASPAWSAAARLLTTTTDKRVVAGVGRDLARVSGQALVAFWSLLTAPAAAGRTLPRIEVSRLRSRGWRDFVFRSPGIRAIREPFDRFLSEAGRRPRRSLIDLHRSVWEQRGHVVPWISLSKGSVRVRPDIALRTPPADFESDLRWGVAHRLLRETNWRPT